MIICLSYHQALSVDCLFVVNHSSAGASQLINNISYILSSAASFSSFSPSDQHKTLPVSRYLTSDR